jgi:trehalose/maltose hydrolase-like predicted phosphorylase/hydroxymethylpyrimidine pyrophosphatase-like HAD family hydrolase
VGDSTATHGGQPGGTGSGPLGDHRYRLIAFDWDGTAVEGRAERPVDLAAAMESLLTAGVTLVVITGTNSKNVSGQIAPLLSVAARQRLFLMVNRGSEVYAYDADGALERLWLRTATAAEEAALDRVANGVRDHLCAEDGLEIGIVRDRLNRRKIDLIPTPEWADPPKSQIGELLAAVNERLAAVPGGIGAVIALTQRLSKEAGLPDARITTDVKHIEVGLTDKSDSIAYLIRRLAPLRAIEPREILIAGDEFGPIAGFEGSDYRMVTRLAAGATIVSVGREPNGVPAGVIRLGGGPAEFLRVLQGQLRAPAMPVRQTAPPPPGHPVELPADGWALEREGYDVVHEATLESLFSLSNGYMGVRGATDEANPGSLREAYVAGLFDGPEAGIEDQVVIADWTHTGIEIEGRELRPWECRDLTHRRRLDLHTMVVTRTLRCTDPDGRRLLLESQRLVSLARRHLGAIRQRLVLEDGPIGRVRLHAGVLTQEGHGPLPHVEVVAAGHSDDVDLLHTRTPGGRVAVDVGIAVAARHDGGGVDTDREVDAAGCGRTVELELAPGEELQVDRFVSVYTERERPLPAVEAEREAREAAALGWDAVLAEHGDAWRATWGRCDVEVAGAAGGVQVGIRFALAQLIGVAPTVDGRCSIAAKGLTGSGYKGHFFWDTDVFLMPFYAAALPEVARRLLEYRLHTLPAALRHAEDAGYSGAWFGWESAASGEDVTPDFVIGPGGRRLEVLTGKREIHVVADIAWSVDRYVRWSGDDRFLDEGGAELIVQAARFFASRVEETPRGFEIRHVIGPDELHEDVNNSAFTNTMAGWTLRRAAGLVDARRAKATLGEPARWRHIADRIVVLHTPDGLLEQHEGFLGLPLPPDERAGRDELAWQRDRMQWRDVKQADVVMLMALLEEQFTPAQQRGNYELYEPLTRHLSSLSEAVHSLVARRLGMHREADDYLRRAFAIDIDDSRGNRAEGLHMATQGGIWQAVALGCAGLRAVEAGLAIDPHMPPGWRQLTLRLTFRGTPLILTLTPDEIEIEARSGAVRIQVGAVEAVVESGTPLRLARGADGWRAAA